MISCWACALYSSKAAFQLVNDTYKQLTKDILSQQQQNEGKKKKVQSEYEMRSILARLRTHGELGGELFRGIS